MLGVLARTQKTSRGGRVMPVLTEYQVVVQCDVCGECDTYAWEVQKNAIKQARKAGWSIGKKVKCPTCKKEKDNG